MSTDRIQDRNPSQLDPGQPQQPTPQKYAASPHGMIATQHHLATEAGVEMLAAGGNAIDAAVAAALALGVCEPAASGLGGQTFMIIHLAETRRTFILDGSSFAPHRVVPGLLTPGDIRRGYKATTVPTTPRVLHYANHQYGALPWQQVVEPAVALAVDGFTVTALLNSLMKRELKHLRAGTAAPHFLKDARHRYSVGECFKQPALADTLGRLARRGAAGFYGGKTARLIQADMIQNGGLIRRDDLAQVRPPLERKPVAGRWDDFRVVTMPPPGAGRTLIEMLNILSCLPRKYRRLNTPEAVVHVSRVMRQAYRDRRDRAYDPNFYAQVSDRRMTSIDYARQIAKRIRTAGDTTHLSVMDRFGNAVGLTQSIERVFGSCCAGEELGFLYNNYLMAYEHQDISHPYYLRPAAVPWASVAPTIMLADRKPQLVIGSPGSERITASILQVLLRLQFQSPLEAVDAPRFYCNIDGQVSLETPRMRSDIPDTLQREGFTVDHRDAYSFYLGCVQMVMREGDHLAGVADPRRDGSAGGPTH